MEQLSGLDACFLYAENDSMHMHVALTAVLDPSTMPGGYSFERIGQHVASRVHLVPPFRKRLVQDPLRINHPYWVQDDNFRIINHLRHVTLPQPGGPEDLGRMVGEITSVPLDRNRPLWELWVIDGLHDGNIALLAKVHHSCVDGVSGLALLTTFFDLEPDAPPIEPPIEPEAAPRPSDLELLAHATRERFRTSMRFGPVIRQAASGFSAVRRVRRTTDLDPGGTPLAAPRTHFNAALTPNRNIAYAHVALDEIKDVKNALGATINDVVLALCAGTLRRYLLGRGELPAQPLVAAVPVSVRGDDEQGDQNNRLSSLLTELATDVADPATRLDLIRRRVVGAKREHQLIGPTTLTDVAELLDPTLMTALLGAYGRGNLADRHRPVVNLLISNVPGPDFPVYLAGARLVRAYPMGPIIEGAGLNITVFSYMNSIDISFLVCDELTPDVWDLADEVPAAFDELKLIAERAGRVSVPT